jgi:hypothetical protein
MSRRAVLSQTSHVPLAPPTGEQRLQVRPYDLLARGRDIDRATGQVT